MLQTATPDAVNARDQAAIDASKSAADEETQELSGLAGHVRHEYYHFRSHRETYGLSNRMLEALRTYRGQYDPTKLANIKRFGGSEIYARLTAVKCRGATALLRDLYLGQEIPWTVEPTPEPTIPTDVLSNIYELVGAEVDSMQAAGQPVDESVVRDRLSQLGMSAKQAARKQARKHAEQSETALNDKLVEGGFYEALAQVLHDLPIFPYAVLKGPVVRQCTKVRWVNRRPQPERRPQMFWQRTSPFDIYYTPGVSDIRDAAVIERIRLSRSDLNSLLGLPGYDDNAIRAALHEYGMGGLHDWLDMTDTERAFLENKESPHFNRSKLMDSLEFHGPVQGSMLLEHGFTSEQISDPDRDYFVTMWIVGRHVLKVQLNPNPKARHPYYVTSFEKIPGGIAGHGLPEILDDIQSAANGALRALMNNMSIASGPQVVILNDRLAPTQINDELYPWKRWHMTSDPMGRQGNKPVDFFQPESNAAELLGIYETFTKIADEISAIPRYMTGGERVGGAGRTASGLAMLMNNTSKVLQNVAANIDREILSPALEVLYDMLMLTDQSGLFAGDESVQVKGVTMAVQKETDRMRQLEFLNLTANPIDTQIVGPKGRAAVLRSVAATLGMEVDDIVPSEEVIDMAMGGGQNGPGPEPGVGPPPQQGPSPPALAGGEQRLGEETDNQHRTVQ